MALAARLQIMAGVQRQLPEKGRLARLQATLEQPSACKGRLQGPAGSQACACPTHLRHSAAALLGSSPHRVSRPPTQRRLPLPPPTWLGAMVHSSGGRITLPLPTATQGRERLVSLQGEQGGQQRISA